jgi:UDP-N-acetylglucosamine 1-carboxyvinyltransferase
MQKKMNPQVTRVDTQASRVDPPVKPQGSEPEQRIIVRGGKPLSGTVRVGGAKNAVLKMMAAALLTNDVTVIRNVPDLTDVHMMADIIRYVGAKVTINGSELSIDARNITDHEAPYELVSQLRASFVVLGPLLARVGEAKVSLPGGCNIGERRIDLHEKGLKQLGAEVWTDHGYVCAKASKLVGTHIYLDRPSNGATENIMLAAVLAEGQTIIENAAQDPEIVNLAEFVNSMGAKVSGAGTYQLVIDGVRPEEMHGSVFDTIPDRLEAGTFVLATLATTGEVTIEGVNPHHLYSVMSKVTAMGGEVCVYAPDVLKVRCFGKPIATDVTTVPYPGFPTDLQAPIMAVLAAAEGTSIITETIYENRFMQVGELRRMGADIALTGSSAAVVKGVPRLMGAEVKSSDLRAAAALIIAGLGAEGVTEVTGLQHLDRGYEGLEEKFRNLGADIYRR